MEPIGFSLVLLGAAGSALWATRREKRRQAVERRLRRELLAAEQRIARAHGQARRDMNDAAGQSWRNLAG